MPQVSELHIAIQTWQHLGFYSWKEVVFTSVPERKLQWNTKHCNGIPGHCKWDELGGMCSVCFSACPGLPDQWRGHLQGIFFVCSLTPPKTDGSNQMNLTVLQWWWKRFWVHKLKGIYLYLVWWVPHLEFDIDLSIDIEYFYTKLWVELNGHNHPSARRVFFFCMCFNL